MNPYKTISEVEKIDFAYSYTKDYIDDRRKEIESINRKLAVLLIFGGFLFCFGVELPHDRPEYVLSKVMVLLFSFVSISNLLYGLSSSRTAKIVKPSYLMEDDCFQRSTAEVKAMIINTHTEGSENIESLVKKKQEVVRMTKGFLLTGTFFLLLNAFWVIHIERQL